MMDNKLLVIIVTYNAMRWAKRCFESLETSSIANDVFVVDNGSKDGTQNYIKKNFPYVIFHQSKENLGFGRANNIGLQYALDNNYDYVYLLNQDAWIDNDTVEKLINVHEKYSHYGILSPIQLQANRTYLDDNFAQIVCSYNSNKEIVSDFYSGLIKQVYPVSFVMAAHWLISKECLKKVGGFSTTFPHYGEDDNYIDRVIYHGYNVGIVPSAKAVHDREGRPITKSKCIYLVYTNNLVFCSKLNESTIAKLCHLLKTTLFSIITNKSLLPLKYFAKIILSWKGIMINVNTSMNVHSAFLK